jgi:ankyrin repeat protein
MSTKLPERASLEFLRKLAKERLAALRAAEPRAKLAAAQLAVAREHGFPSWRALKAEIERLRAAEVAAFFEACARGDGAAVLAYLQRDAGLVGERRPPHGSSGLHLAASGGHLDAVRSLLAHGADPDARDGADNASPLHLAAGGGHVEVARALLDAGADVHGAGDVHLADVIGWATSLGELRRDVLELLLSRGARHHVFSAIAAGDAAAIQELADVDPAALDRRMSRFEQGQTALHFAAGRGRHELLALLIDLGADLEAEDLNGQTALASAMLRGDRAAMRTLRAAGAAEPVVARPAEPGVAGLAGSIRAMEPMLRVEDMRATVAWYRSIGFALAASHEEAGELDFARLTFGRAGLALSPGGASRDVTLWFTVDRIDRLYRLFKQRQLAAAQAVLSGAPFEQPEVRFVEDLYEPFYGGRQFSVSDPGGVHLVFHEP